MTGTVCEVEDIEYKFNRFSWYVRVRLDGLNSDAIKLFSITDLKLLNERK